MEELTTKQRIMQTIGELPENTTIEEAIDRLTLLHKVSIGLQQSGQDDGMSQAEVERHFQQRRNSRKN
jgi:hypothetical protein